MVMMMMMKEMMEGKDTCRRRPAADSHLPAATSYIYTHSIIIMNMIIRIIIMIIRIMMMVKCSNHGVLSAWLISIKGHRYLLSNLALNFTLTRFRIGLI